MAVLVMNKIFFVCMELISALSKTLTFLLRLMFLQALLQLRVKIASVQAKSKSRVASYRIASIEICVPGQESIFITFTLTTSPTCHHMMRAVHERIAHLEIWTSPSAQRRYQQMRRIHYVPDGSCNHMPGLRSSMDRTSLRNVWAPQVTSGSASMLSTMSSRVGMPVLSSASDLMSDPQACRSWVTFAGEKVLRRKPRHKDRASATW